MGIPKERPTRVLHICHLSYFDSYTSYLTRHSPYLSLAIFEQRALDALKGLAERLEPPRAQQRASCDQHVGAGGGSELCGVRIDTAIDGNVAQLRVLTAQLGHLVKDRVLK